MTKSAGYSSSIVGSQWIIFKTEKKSSSRECYILKTKVLKWLEVVGSGCLLRVKWLVRDGKGFTLLFINLIIMFVFQNSVHMKLDTMLKIILCAPK